MPIALSSRRLGDITLVTCGGRIVEGAESTALQTLIDDLLPDGPFLILDMGVVEFIDSSGLGLLVRYLTRARNARGALKLCAVSPKLADVLRITHLDRVFESYASEADAIGAIYQRARSTDAPFRFGTDILCIHDSGDVQAYVQEILGLAGYGVIAAGNLPDALILLQATQPKLVLVGASLRQAGGTPLEHTFDQLGGGISVMELPADFSRWDAGEAGRRLLDHVRTLIVVS